MVQAVHILDISNTPDIKLVVVVEIREKLEKKIQKI